MATGTGQLDPDGKLKSSYAPHPPDRMFITLRLEEDLRDRVLPVGANAWIAIRGDSWKELFIIRQVIMRWYTWTNYIFAGY